MVEALKIAGSDSRVKGLTATIGANEQFMGLAQIQELRNAVADFRYHCFLACSSPVAGSLQVTAKI